MEGAQKKKRSLCLLKMFAKAPQNCNKKIKN